MGTRSLTFVYDDGPYEGIPVINMYRQFDGYPSGHGQELAAFLISGKLVNGIRIGSKNVVFNGMGCLAAQLVAELKTEPGGFYLYPIDCTDCGQEYEYHVYDNKVVVKNPGEVIFKGSWSEFYDWCYSEVNA